ncbi:MAG TPA: hypothetical protein VMQ65_06570 [Candidatus Limnocylindria bacterium]|nr:hypothetical protein [Candidatus Limnocylindria bacterium]
MGTRPVAAWAAAGPARLALLLVAAIVVTTACAAGSRTTFPPLGSTPAPVGEATAATRGQIVAALAAVGLQAIDANRAHRPPEGPLLAAAPRSVLQATLPDDPGHGFIVIYALPSDAAAAAAAADHAAYVASGIGRVNFAFDSRFVLRVAGSTVLFFHWSPGAALDDRTRLIEDALGTVGTEVQIPS